MADWDQIETELGALLQEAGYELVDLQTSTGRGAHVTVFADRLSEPGTIELDDCAVLSRLVSRYLDQVDPIPGPYRLQVSSPGLDRPLRRPEHFARVVGQTVRVRQEGASGRATYTGRLLAADDQGVRVLAERGEVLIAWPEVSRANLVYDWGD